MNDTPLLAGRGLGKHYLMGAEPVPALRAVDIDIHAGEFLALRGPSGSGKSTLINLLGLLDRPDRGTLHLDGRDTATLDENARADIRRDRFGFIFQSFNLIPVLSTAENIAYPVLLRPGSIDRNAMTARAQALLGAVGLADKENVRPDLLSGGQRQRVAIARALVNEPAILFADEPTANLDSHTADMILDLLQALNREKRLAVVIATHDPRVVERCARVVTLRDGEAVAA
jgi:putative ABC transport system ATP-binding protein